MRNRYLMIAALAVGFVALWGTPAVAFHDGGVAHCNGCHTMHNSQDGADMADSALGNNFLLRQSTASDTCLRCHAHRLGAFFGETGNEDDPTVAPPVYGGGAFVYLLATELYDGGGSSTSISGDGAGHNINTVDHAVNFPDGQLTESPGGAFQASELECTSCHDPHGSGGAFRLLYTVDFFANPPLPGGPLLSDGTTRYSFAEAAPDAYGISIFGAAEANNNHTAYVSGMSAWCGNCHDTFHDVPANEFKHPSDEAIGGLSNIYNAYNGTDDVTGGVFDTAYLALVPFEDSTHTDLSTASDDGTTQNSVVMCTTCHRAHASSGPDSGRWDFNVTFLDEDGLKSDAAAIPNPYGPNQRSLCNKCHRKDLQQQPYTP